MKHVKLFEQFTNTQSLNEGKVNTSKVIQRIEKNWEPADNILEISDKALNSKVTINFVVKMPSLERVQLMMKVQSSGESILDLREQQSQLRQIIELEGGIPLMVSFQPRSGNTYWTVEFMGPEGFENSELLKDKDKLNLVANLIRDRLDIEQQKRSKATRIARWIKSDAKTNPDHNHMEDLAEAASLFISAVL